MLEGVLGRSINRGVYNKNRKSAFKQSRALLIKTLFNEASKRHNISTSEGGGWGLVAYVRVGLIIKIIVIVIIIIIMNLILYFMSYSSGQCLTNWGDCIIYIKLVIY